MNEHGQLYYGQGATVEHDLNTYSPHGPVEKVPRIRHAAARPKKHIARKPVPKKRVTRRRR